MYRIHVQINKYTNYWLILQVNSILFFQSSNKISFRPLKILAYQNSVATLELSQSYSDIYRCYQIAGQ